MHRSFLSTSFTICLILVGVTLSSASEPGSGRHEAAPEELKALEFLIGDWDLTTSFAQTDGSRREEAARLVGRWALGGFGISVEETHGYADGAGGLFISTILYTVQPRSGRLVGVSNNTLGNRKLYEVSVEKDRIVIRQSGELFEGREGFNRLVLFIISPQRYELRLDACVEGVEREERGEGTYSYVAKRRAAN